MILTQTKLAITTQHWSLGLLVCCVLGTSLFLASCSGTNDATDDAILIEWMGKGSITGFDARRCASPCCGGWFIQIDGRRHRFLAFPEGTDSTLQTYRSEDFPIPVVLIWTSDSTEQKCTHDLITIQAIARES